MEDYGYIKRNYESLRQELDRLAEELSVPKIKLVCVTKSGSDEELLALCRAGAADIGENRPGELSRRGELLRAEGLTPSLHEIGTLQRNKVKYIIDKVALIHSLDKLSLAEEIDRRAGAIGRRVPVLIEVNSAAEENKSGATFEYARELAEAIKDFKNITLMGLMTMGPAVSDPEKLRPYFRMTKRLFDEMKSEGLFHGDGILSMGMSESWRVAVEEGSTLVRVGRHLFIKD
ncbi:MAG: YggS family pyridoxal phosphate-dependent enzyme [Clostridia bacterium]|nr:YggS family pyridoxal phosphate-dependent enzyme [Clostridia bacterium]